MNTHLNAHLRCFVSFALHSSPCSFEVLLLFVPFSCVWVYGSPGRFAVGAVLACSSFSLVPGTRIPCRVVLFQDPSTPPFVLPRLFLCLTLGSSVLVARSHPRCCSLSLEESPGNPPPSPAARASVVFLNRSTTGGCARAVLFSRPVRKFFS